MTINMRREAARRCLEQQRIATIEQLTNVGVVLCLGSGLGAGSEFVTIRSDTLYAVTCCPARKPGYSWLSMAPSSTTLDHNTLFMATLAHEIWRLC